MTDWSVRLEIDALITSDEAGELLDELTPHGAVIIGGGSLGFAVRLSVEAVDPMLAIRSAIRPVFDTLRHLDIESGPVVEVEAVTMERLVAQNQGLDRAELYVGIADIARARGVSRQRAHELTQLPGFPEPVASTSAGRVWRNVDVESFLAKPRPPGRPAKVNAKTIKTKVSFGNTPTTKKIKAAPTRSRDHRSRI